MQVLANHIVQFFREQGFVIVSTIDADGSLHSSCKGIVKIDQKGAVYLLDLYRGRTYANLKRNARISITAVDEHKFTGFALKGKARIMPQKELDARIMQAWESRITARLTRRLIKNIREEKGHSRHPEVLLPKPEYLIVMKVEEVVNLTMQQIKEEV